MKIKEEKIDSFGNFEKYVKQHSNNDTVRLYRGQEEAAWSLSAKLYRIAYQKGEIRNFHAIEQRIFSEFKEALEKRGMDKREQTDWDVLSIGQHYGLPTRLIDWTLNPLIAIWFASEKAKSNNNDRVVWRLDVDEKHLADFQSDKLFGERFIKIFQPPKIDARIVAQKSWFSVQNMKIYGKKAGFGDGLPRMNDYNIMNENEDFEYDLVKIVIPDKLRKEILTHLDNHGINYSTVFPDISGDCKNIEWKISEFSNVLHQ